MKTKIKQIDGLQEYINDNEYRVATVVGTQIRLANESPSMTMKFYLNTPVSGGNITISTDGGATSIALKDGEGNAVTELDAGLKEVAYVTPFFILRSAGGLKEFFGDGSDGTIPDLNVVTTAPNGGTVANLWDMNAGTVFTTGTLSSASDQVVFSMDFGKPYLIHPISGTGFQTYSTSISTGTARNLSLEYSSDGISWTSVGTSSATTTPADKDIGNITTIPYRYWRLVLQAGGSSCTLTIQGVTINKIPTDTQTTKIFRILEPSTLNGAAVIKQYTTYTLPVGYEHTTQNPCQGLIIYSQGNATINGILDMSQKAGLAPNGNTIPMLITKKAFKTAKTSSLLHFDNNITDDNGRTWTNNGGATFDATNKKFGTHAISFTTGTSYLTTPISDDFSFNGDDFTIDFWFRTTSINVERFMYSDAAPGPSGSVEICTIAGGAVRVYITTLDGTVYSVTSSNQVVIDTFYHLALVKDNGTIKLFINGILVGFLLLQIPIRACRNTPTLARRGDGSGVWFGQIDEFRIIKGKAMYTANFTPPTSAYTYTATYTEEPKTLEKYFQLSNVLQNLRGGYGGNGGYGGGYSGATGRQTSVGIGGAGRQNLGGFGGGGSGGATNNAHGGIGGSILNVEIGGGELPAIGFNSGSGFQFYGNSSIGINGSGGYGSANMPTSTATIPKTGKCLGGGSGGQGGAATGVPLVTSDSQYSGGLACLIVGENFINNGTIRVNGGNGSNGSNAVGSNTGGGGGGGGAGGGVISIFHKGTYTNSGTVQVNGGAGGIGGAGVVTGEAGGNGTAGGVGTIHVQKL